jgi:RNA polymerase sigma-70 factor (ECF subfamily)
MDTWQRSTQIDEEALVREATNGDLEAFNQLVLKYQDMAYSHARVLLGDPAQAEDATQESFLKAFQGMSRFRGSSFRGWLLKIVTNSACDTLRRSHRHPTQPLFPEDEYGEEIGSPLWLADPAPPMQHMVEENELLNDISKMLEELPDVYRQVLTLIDVNELDYTEAAQVLAVPVGTVKSRLARARLKISEILRQAENRPFCLYCPA